MTVFDLVFIILFLSTLGVLGAAAVTAMRGRRVRSLSLLRRLGIAAAAYLAVVVLVSIATPRHFVDVGDNQCSDDWCIAVDNMGRHQAQGGVAYEVSFRLSSRARRVTQRERNVVPYVEDGRGRRYEANADP